MYETLMNTLRTFFGYGSLRIALTAAVGFSVAILAAYMSPAFREYMKKTKEEGSWRSTLAFTGTGIFKFLLVFVLVRFFITVLSYQANVFTLQHGRITGQNRSAVLMKWGYPHEQKELKVHFTRKRAWITRQLQVKAGKGDRVYSESFWKDEEYPMQAVDGKMPTLLSVKEQMRSVSVNQKAIVSADVDISINNNPRTLGNANYAGYNDAWSLKYRIANRSSWETVAHMTFPLPCKSGLFDEMVLKVNGKDVLDSAKSSGNSLCWYVNMPAETEVDVEISYKSRGLEHLRYIPMRMTQTGHYRVSMTVNGIPADKLDYPIGSMPPAEKLTDINTQPFTLNWKLDNALTSYDIGVKLPVAEQPNYHFAMLLREAPVGLMLLMVLLCLPRLVTSKAVRMDIIAILGIAYCLHFTFMGRLADVLSGFTLPFLISAGILVLTITWLRMSDKGWLFIRLQDAVMFAIATVLYPLIIVDGDKTALWMQYLYMFVLVYSCVLLMCYNFPRRKKD